MLSNRQLFLQYLAQTSDFPLLLEIEQADGVYLYNTQGEKILDLISGISVSSIGHRHPEVLKAITDQIGKYLHLMVYGEFVETPQVQLANLLTHHLPASLNNVYFVNSGAEAVEGALKLAKRYTGRAGIIAYKNAYHGATHGALSVAGDENFKNAFRPLLPGISQIELNNFEQLSLISDKTACVIIEPVQGEAGVRVPYDGFLAALRKRCDETGVLLIFDEIQTGFSRTGPLFAFQDYGIVPDILLLAKALGGGMPLGAFIASSHIMQVLKTNPVLGHITTFGGHPVSCAAAYAAMNVVLKIRKDEIVRKGELFKKLLVHEEIKEIRSAGLMIAVELESFEKVQKVITSALHRGVLMDWFLFCPNSIRIAPPLIVTEEQIREACQIILDCLNEIT